MFIPQHYDERKAAESAAFLLHRASGTLPLIKLIKLLYLAERLSLKRYGEPLTGDRLVSLDHGPVLSRTYDHIKGAVQSSPGGWETWVSDRAGYMVALKDPSMIRTPEQDLGALSDSDLEVLDEVWAEFGHLERWALVGHTHDHCPEWEDPDGSMVPITYERLFAALGYGPDETTALVERIAEQAKLGAPVAHV